MVWARCGELNDGDSVAGRAVAHGAVWGGQIWLLIMVILNTLGSGVSLCVRGNPSK